MFNEDLLAAAREALAECTTKDVTLAVAESCTGGLVSAALTSIPGCSHVLEAGFVTYANSAKETTLGVAPSLIRTQGAVSRDVAIAMARGALACTSAAVSVALTGIAGPDGGSAEKPVGLVHIAVCTDTGDCVHDSRVFPGDRDAVRLAAAIEALRMVARVLTAER